MKDRKKIEAFLDHLISVSTPSQPAWNKEAVLEGTAPKWNYIDGCMIKGILEMYHATKEEKYIWFAESFIDYYVKEDGTLLGYDLKELNCDNINQGKVLFDLLDYSKKEKYKKALDLLYSQIMVQPRTKEGNFWHKKIYPYQIWLDGLYMVQPFYLEYEKRFNGYKNYLDVFKQFENVQKIMKNEETGLFYHGYDETKEMFWADKKTGLSKNFWTRSLGWYSMALVDTLEVMDEQFFMEYRSLQLNLKELLDSLINFQDKETKMFYQVTTKGDRAGNYLETSGSCAIAYSLMKGAKCGHLPEEYFNYGKDIFESVLKYKLEEKNGILVLKDICLIAGLGGMPGKGNYKDRDGSFEYYISEPIVDDDAKGVAPFLFAAAYSIAP